MQKSESWYGWVMGVSPQPTASPARTQNLHTVGWFTKELFQWQMSSLTSVAAETLWAKAT